MNRRLALKQLALAAGGIALIPSCTFSEEEVLTAYDELEITASDAEQLQAVIDTIFPKTTLKGGVELGVDQFVLVMANDCLAENEQQQFVKGLKGFGSFTKENFGTSFTKMDEAERKTHLQSMMAGTEKEGEQQLATQKFLAITKKFGLQGYMKSEYYMTEIMPYQQVPGPVFIGKKKIDASEKVNING